MKNFYEHQDHAFSETAKLILMLALAIAGTVFLSALASTYVVAVFLYYEGLPPEECWPLLEGIFVFFSCGFGLLVAVGSVRKLRALKGGGAPLALSLGGRLAEPESSQEERTLCNIVEEMAISSGVAVPEVYLLSNEEGINAFAAGYHRDEAVIGVTQGAVRHLRRDELQGVIAHEFSHILNGDMALNLRMLGWLHGILTITMLAQLFMNKGIYWLGSTRDRGGVLGLALILFGAVMWCVGSVGALMAMLLKAATNRQREFLADAFAVQFTRHPEGLANAFKRLAGHGPGSHVRNRNGYEASHLFLANGCKMTGGLASHPPLKERILRLDPHWDGTPLYEESEAEASIDHSIGFAPRHASRQLDCPEERVDELEMEQNRERVLSDLPAEIHKIVALPDGAELYICAVWLLELKQDERNKCVNQIRSDGMESLENLLRGYNPTERLALLDTAMENLPNAVERPLLREFASMPAGASVFHWMLRTMIDRRMEGSCSRPIEHAKIESVGAAAEYALSFFCHSGNSEAMASFAFQRGLASLGLENAELRVAEEMNLEQFDASIEVLSKLAPVPKRKMLLGFAATLAADSEVSEPEAYLLRGICVQFGFAPTRLLIGQTLSPSMC